MSEQANSSGLQPLGHRILVYVFPAERKTSGGLVIPEEVAQKEDMKQIRAMVKAIGSTAWMDTPGYDKPWVNPGDTVYIAKFAGHKVTGRDGVEYRIINDLDITLREDTDNGFN